MARIGSAMPKCWRDRRGAAALEMAAVAPALLLLMVAGVDFGRLTSQKIELNNALRAGAQLAVTASNAPRTIEATVKDALPAHLKAATIAAKCYCGPLPAGTGLPPEAVCDTDCPTGSARFMTLNATVPFRPVNFAITPALASRFNFNQVNGNVTIRHR